MSNLTPQRRKWLGVAMIAMAIVIVVSILLSPAGSFVGDALHYGMGGYGHHGYLDHMAGPGMMRGGSAGLHSMHHGVTTIPGLSMMSLLEYDNFEFSDEQRRRFREIRQQISEDRRELLDRLYDEQRKMDDLLRAEDPDPQLAGQQYARCTDLRRKILELEINEWRRIDEVLTEEQRDELRGRRHYWMKYGKEY